MLYRSFRYRKKPYRAVGTPEVRSFLSSISLSPRPFARLTEDWHNPSICESSLPLIPNSRIAPEHNTLWAMIRCCCLLGFKIKESSYIVNKTNDPYRCECQIWKKNDIIIYNSRFDTIAFGFRAIRLEEGIQDWLAMGLSISVGEEKTPVKEDTN